MKVSRRGQDHDCGVSPLFDRPVSAESLSKNTQVMVYTVPEKHDPFDKHDVFFRGVRILAGRVDDIDKKPAQHFWAYDFDIPDLCEIARAIRLRIKDDKSGFWAKHYSSLIGEFAQTVATAIEGIRISEEENEDSDEG